MTRVVELRYIGGKLSDLMHAMQAWLDSNGIKPENFQYSQAPPGLAFRVGFKDRAEAAAFAKAFNGWVECADGQGAARWICPPLPPTAANRPMPRVSCG